MRFSLLLLLFCISTACISLDGFLFNGIPCERVGRDTCEENPVYWDRICVVCKDPYDWQIEYDWMPDTLNEGESIRPVDPLLVERHQLNTSDRTGVLDAYWIESHGAIPAHSQTTIIYNHGNYAGIEHYQPRVRMLHEAGYNVFVWDYRGYGKSIPARHPTPLEFIEDAGTVHELVTSLAPNPDRIIPYGYSLGAIPAVEQSVSGRSCALILEAPFTSIAQMISSNAGLSLGEEMLSGGYFDNPRKLENHDGPVLGMIGSLDTTFPADDVRFLIEANAGPGEMWILPGVRHGISDVGIPEAGMSEYFEKISGFLHEHNCAGQP